MPAEGAEDAPRRCEYYDGEGWVGLYQQFVRKVKLWQPFSCTSHAKITLSASFPCRSSEHIITEHSDAGSSTELQCESSTSNIRTCPVLFRSSNWDTATTFLPIVLQVSTTHHGTPSVRVDGPSSTSVEPSTPIPGMCLNLGR